MTKCSKKDADLACDGAFYKLSDIHEYRSIAPKVRRQLRGLVFMRPPHEIARQLRDAEKTGKPRPM